MKIRIRDNSVRLRLDQDEISRLSKDGEIECMTVFGAENHLTLRYRLQLFDGDQISAHFTGSAITVFIPKQTGLDWASSDLVSLENVFDNGTESGLRILLEKDFACLTDRPGEDESRAFPNPNTTC